MSVAQPPHHGETTGAFISTNDIFDKVTDLEKQIISLKAGLQVFVFIGAPIMSAIVAYVTTKLGS